MMCNFQGWRNHQTGQYLKKENTPLLRVPTGTPVAKATNDTSSLRVQRNSGPHIIPLDDGSYSNLPPPKPHPIS
eukprot:5105215-Ditylum_brightwellii.AAC.1